MDEKEKLRLRKQEDLKFTQGCVCAVIATIIEFMLFQVRDDYFNLVTTVESVERATQIENMLYASRYLGVIMAVLGFIWVAYSINTGKQKVFSGFALAATGLVIFACGHGILVYQQSGLNVLMLLVPAWGGLGLVYFLYQIEFFLSAFFTSLGGVGLWLFRQTPLYSDSTVPMTSQQTTFYGFLNVSIFVVLLGFYLVNKASRTEGILKVKKQEITLISDMKDSSSFWLVGLSCVLSLASLASTLLLGTAVAYYAIFALLGWLFVLLVYFTVKLM